MEPIRVLIVEDDPMVADINTRFTEAVKGFTVVGTARDGQEALQLLAECRPDLVILDVYMPHLDGLSVLAKLRQEAASVDVILITAANDSESVRQARQGGAIDYIIKPFKFDRYQRTLESYREYRGKVFQQESFTQAELDQAREIKKEAPPQGLPKNLHPQTLGLVVNLLSRAQGALSAEEVAGELGLSRATARRYLEYLTETEKVSLVLEYASVGRPVHRFRLHAY
ncbi:response regulator [uncultured Anaeromusa sp.]|uniref:response regulator n=1 Tax=uncultured Anaeromusa sp. TaxID=673273 RepID=UPI0029C914AA|nr:response regulator [uncultured Anaeromusa sp.]